jgi:hypothetical protein
MSGKVRFITHRDVNAGDIAEVLRRIKEFSGRSDGGRPAP